jgi:hypothetical protein
LAVGASVVVLAPSTALAQPVSPYAFDTSGLTTPLNDIAPAVGDVTPELSVDPAAHLPMNANGLPKTGGEIMERIWFAMLLVAAGLLAREASPKRQAWAR